MFKASIDEILMYFYNAIDSKKLSEDKIIIDEENVSEKSKELYLQKFAMYLNNYACRGYKLSGSIISKLLNIIEFDGYQDQIITQYNAIISEYMRDYIIEPSKDYLNPKEAIEFINKYISLDDDKIVSYGDNKKFIVGDYKYLLEEIDKPIPMIINDIQQWIENLPQE